MEMVEEGQNRPQISREWMNVEEFVDEGGEDRISTLPESLLIEILSRLPSTKDAIRTGTLSKRWKLLWTSVSTLSFTSMDYDHFCPQNPNVRPDFFSLVDKTLTQCRQLTLKKFEVYSGYETRFESQANNWIRYAMTHDVEELNLSFQNMEFKVEVLLDQVLFICSCFRDLTLKGCKLNPSGAISWKNLRSLSIDSKKLDEDLIENILSGSPVLETLELNCGGFRRLDITSKSVKKLVFSSGYIDPECIFGVDSLEINAPNILSLTIHHNVMSWKLFLLNVSSVVEANLDFTTMLHWGAMRNKAEEEMLKGLILSLRHVKELKIGGFCSAAVSRLKAKVFDFPSNIKFCLREVLLHDDGVEDD